MNAYTNPKHTTTTSTCDGMASALVRDEAPAPYVRPELIRMNVANTEVGPFGRGESGTALLDYINGGG